MINALTQKMTAIALASGVTKMWLFRKKPKQVYYHAEWTQHNLNEIKIKIDKVRVKIKQRIKEFDAST